MKGLHSFVAEKKSEHERKTDLNLTPSNNFCRRLHWGVMGLRPSLGLSEAGEGPLCRGVIYRERPYADMCCVHAISAPTHTI